MNAIGKLYFGKTSEKDVLDIKSGRHKKNLSYKKLKAAKNTGG